MILSDLSLRLAGNEFNGQKVISFSLDKLLSSFVIAHLYCTLGLILYPHSHADHLASYKPII